MNGHPVLVTQKRRFHLVSQEPVTTFHDGRVETVRCHAALGEPVIQISGCQKVRYCRIVIRFRECC
jgi:hypothetical protein